jgi:hypothetical protein
MFYLPKFFQKKTPIPELNVDLFRISKSGSEAPTAQPAPQSQAAPASAARPPSIRDYGIKTGGVVTRDMAPCRVSPSESARVAATMRKDSVLFATKEARYSNGEIWYYVSNSQFEGWARGGDVKVYKF